MSKPPRILVTGAGGPGTVNLCRSFRRAPEPVVLVGTDCDKAFATLALCDEVHLVPRAGDEQAYIAALAKVVRERSIDVIVPNNSIEIRVLAEHRDRLGAPIRIPSLKALDMANSKWASWQVWKEAGVPVPDTHLLQAPEDVDRAFETFEAHPVWVRGAGIPGKGIGVASLPCRTPEQARAWIDYWNGWGGMIASEFLPGDNLTWIGIFDHGRLITSQSRFRDRYVIPHVSPSGITGAPALSHTVTSESFFDTAYSAAKLLDEDYDGVVFIDLKGDANNQARVTEANAGRFGTTHFFYTAAGLNLPWLLVLGALGRPLPDVPERDPLEPDQYWVRTLDAGPVLIAGEDLRAGRLHKGQRLGLHGAVEDHPPALLSEA
jgi:predicted ATP-grasp superfamily ATP-dependent carboligase